MPLEGCGMAWQSTPLQSTSRLGGQNKADRDQRAMQEGMRLRKNMLEPALSNFNVELRSSEMMRFLKQQ